jgi:hypothetical protein
MHLSSPEKQLFVVECLGNLKSDQAKFGEEMTHASRKF